MARRGFVGVLVLLLAACDGAKSGEGGGEPKSPPPAPRPEPQRVEVEHILIGVTHARLAGVDRTVDAARKRAHDLMERARSGTDFILLRNEYSDDREKGEAVGGGPYLVRNHGVSPADGKERPRKGMVKRFGDVAFSLEVGGIGLAEHDERDCPFGFHIVKRVK